MCTAAKCGSSIRPSKIKFRIGVSPDLEIKAIAYPKFFCGDRGDRPSGLGVLSAMHFRRAIASRWTTWIVAPACVLFCALLRRSVRQARVNRELKVQEWAFNL